MSIFAAGRGASLSEGEGCVREGGGGEPVDVHARDRRRPPQVAQHELRRDQWLDDAGFR